MVSEVVYVARTSENQHKLYRGSRHCWYDVDDMGEQLFLHELTRDEHSVVASAWSLSPPVVVNAFIVEGSGVVCAGWQPVKFVSAEVRSMYVRQFGWTSIPIHKD